MFNRKLYTLLMVLLLAVLGMPGQAAVAAGHGTGRVYVSPILAHWMSYQSQNMMKNGFLWGARVGVDIMPTIGVGVFGMRGLTEVNNITDRLTAGITTINAKYDAYGVEVRLNLPGFVNYVPYLSASGGQARAKFDAPITSIKNSKVSVDKIEKRNLWTFGAGVEIFLTRNVALRFDAQDHFINKDFISGDWLGDCKTHNWELGAGVTLLLGGRKKALETTPASTKVDISSSPVPVKTEKPMKVKEKPEKSMTPPVKWVDSDGDGVPDSMDKCPGTPAGVPVDVNGCPKYSPEQYEIMCLFDFDKSDIKPEFSNALDDLANLVLKTRARLSITGYADQVGTLEYNIQLADRRAHAVMDYLVARGVPAGRLELKAFGEYPIDADGNPVAYYQRCVQFKLIK